MEISDIIKEKVRHAVKEKYDLTHQNVQIEHPENEKFGDYATNVALELAKIVKQNPMEIAKNLCYELQRNSSLTDMKGGEEKIFESIEVAPPGFINFKLSLEWLQDVLIKINKQETSYGSGDFGGKKRIALEHSNVNPNKAAHIGHLRNAAIGQFLEKVYEFLGYDVEVQYYANDLGVQVTTSTMGLEKLNQIDPENYKKFDHYMWDVYSTMANMIEEDPELKEELNKLLVKLEDPDSPQSERQKELATRILKDNLQTFAKLGFDYDVIVYESDIARIKLWEKAFEILKKNENFYLAEEGPSKGCWLVRMGEKDEKEVVKEGKVIEEDKIIVRSNGVATYTGKDIAYHMWKFGLLDLDFHYEKFETDTQKKPLWATTPQLHKPGEEITFSNVDKVFDVIDVKQTYAIDVVKQSLKYLGYDKSAQNMVHINYGFVYLSPETAAALGVDTSDGKKRYAMSGRKGWGIKIDDFIDMVDDKLRQEYGEFSTIKEVRNGAVKFEMLKFNTFQDLVFDLNSALSIKGFSGPYIQYTYARANSVLKKYEGEVEPVRAEALDEKELAVLRMLYKFPEVVQRSADEFAPNLMCGYLFELCQKFNTFYNDLPILNAENSETRKFRVLLTSGVKTVIRNGLSLLGIEAPEKM